jgi:hypothetical protein
MINARISEILVVGYFHDEKIGSRKDAATMSESRVGQATSCGMPLIYRARSGGGLITIECFASVLSLLEQNDK